MNWSVRGENFWEHCETAKAYKTFLKLSTSPMTKNHHLIGNIKDSSTLLDCWLFAVDKKSIVIRWTPTNQEHLLSIRNEFEHPNAETSSAAIVWKQLMYHKVLQIDEQKLKPKIITQCIDQVTSLPEPFYATLMEKASASRCCKGSAGLLGSCSLIGAKQTIRRMNGTKNLVHLNEKQVNRVYDRYCPRHCLLKQGEFDLLQLSLGGVVVQRFTFPTYSVKRHFSPGLATVSTGACASSESSR